MTSAYIDDEEVKLVLTRSEAVILLEWLSRNWNRTHWDDPKSFSDPAEKQLLIWLENDLEKLLPEPFDPKYKEILSKCYRDVVPDPKEWD